MKTRHGFVSNSSSTSFTFVFKGEDVKNLSDTILKYKEHFKLSHDAGWGDSDDVYYRCNAQDVAEAIESCVEKTKDDKWDVVKIVSIEDHIESLIASIKEMDSWIKRDEKKKGSHPDYYDEAKADYKAEIEKMRAAIKNGLTSVIIINFGDNDGDVSGGDVGYSMDYNGRYIKINEKDFIVFTEQNR